MFRKYLSTLSLTAVVRAGAPRKAWWAHADEVQHTRTTAVRLRVERYLRNTTLEPPFDQRATQPPQTGNTWPTKQAAASLQR